ncbi:conserved exported hypothetical protein [Burkholderiales bacterium 8X]|nr:conserved exported hypothetical protein [Burkholderiales bacterium 8X]
MINHIKKALYLLVFTASFSAVATPSDDYFRAIKSDNDDSLIKLFNRGFDPNTKDSQGQPGLLLAIKEPSPKVTKVFLDFSKTNVEARNPKDESPLMMAALKGQQDVVARLVARDADVNKPGWTPLHYAATNGHVAIIKLLLDKYAFIDAQSPNGTTPLMMAAMYGSTDAVKLLIEEGADVLMKNEQGMTAADFAERGKRPDAIQLLGAAMRAKRPPSDGKW